MFSWVPFYREVVGILLRHEDKQDELIALLKQMQEAELKTIILNDQSAPGQSVPLAAIDPFTFLATFHRTGDPMRHKLWAFLKEAWHISATLPTDFAGIPTVNAQQSWFFPYLYARQADDISSLWQFADLVFKHPPDLLDADLFRRCLQVGSVGLAKLTIGMFWLNPTHYLSLDSVMVSYLEKRGIEWDGVGLNSGDISIYRALLSEVHEKLGYEHPKLSYEAWQQAQAGTRKRRYWAGGHDWDGGQNSQKERFIENNEWQVGYKLDDESPAAKKVRSLFSQIAMGDEFAIKGCSPTHLAIYYLGRVMEIDPETQTLKLERLTDRELYQGPRPTGAGAGNWLDTLLEVKRPQEIESVFDVRPAHVVDPPPSHAVDLPPFPLNRILYGPPGTGKTHTSIEKAVEIIDGTLPQDESGTTDHAACKQKFDELRQQGRIQFVTFHQSFSYEDFVEGIRPQLDTSTESGARYECRAGILKEIALEALGACLEPSQPSSLTFDDVWAALIQRIAEAPETKYPGLSSQSEFTLAVTAENNIEGRNIKSEALHNNYLCSRKHAELIWKEYRNQPKVNSTEVYAITGNAHTHFIAAIVNELKKMTGQVKPTRPTSHKAKAESYLTGSDDYQISPGPHPRYVLIADEINRANVSRVLGELITLLEEDKRLALSEEARRKGNELRVELPYSGETFALPANLYVLGTMNTADKSLALLDIALRRRFEFEEMPPKFSVCRDLSEPMRQVLTELNRRLTVARDREHCIGHAYFVGVKDEIGFNRVFKRQIIPLLQEFFYNDWESLRFALNETSDTGRFVRTLKSDDTTRQRTRWAWWFDLTDEPFDCLAELQKNYNIEPVQPAPSESQPGASSADAPEANAPEANAPEANTAEVGVNSNAANGSSPTEIAPTTAASNQALAQASPTPES